MSRRNPGFRASQETADRGIARRKEFSKESHAARVR